MNKDVLVRISGIQTEVEGEDKVELTTTGSYYLKNGKHYIMYEEISDDNEVVKNILKIGPKTVELTKRGSTSSHMVFEEGKENLSYYDTPLGSLLLGVNTSGIKWEEQENKMNLKVNYDLTINSDYVSNCMIDVNIQPNNEKSGLEA